MDLLGISDPLDLLVVCKYELSPKFFLEHTTRGTCCDSSCVVSATMWFGFLSDAFAPVPSLRSMVLLSKVS